VWRVLGWGESIFTCDLLCLGPVGISTLSGHAFPRHFWK
jgi:hypothetical protein